MLSTGNMRHHHMLQTNMQAEHQSHHAYIKSTSSYTIIYIKTSHIMAPQSSAHTLLPADDPTVQNCYWYLRRSIFTCCLLICRHTTITIHRIPGRPVIISKRTHTSTVSMSMWPLPGEYIHTEQNSYSRKRYAVSTRMLQRLCEVGGDKLVKQHHTDHGHSVKTKFAPMRCSSSRPSATSPNTTCFPVPHTSCVYQRIH